jgi:hypothetical protein
MNQDQAISIRRAQRADIPSITACVRDAYELSNTITGSSQDTRACFYAKASLDSTPCGRCIRFAGNIKVWRNPRGRVPVVKDDLANMPDGTHLFRQFELDIDRPNIPYLQTWYERLQAMPS